MRIVFINAIDVAGGAGIVATRLSNELSSKGHYCYFLVATKRGAADNVYQVRRGFGRIFESVITRVFNWIGLQYMWYPFSSRLILQKIVELRPDVISLHNTHGGYFATPLLKELSKAAPVVWTLHDMWAFTGNAAHTFGDESWLSMRNTKSLTKIYPAIGFNTGAFLIRKKLKIYGESNLTIVTPSKWLLALAMKSPVFKGKNIIHVNNGVDLSTFKREPRASARSRMGIPSDAKVIMFSAEFLRSNIWKGGADLWNTLRLLEGKSNAPVHVLIVGRGGLPALASLKNLVAHPVGYVDSQAEMISYYCASDVVLYPTRADNLPNVLVEATACGVPCVTFEVGGCPEIVNHNKNGWVGAPGDCEGMANAIMELLKNPGRLAEMSVAARNLAEEKFSITQMASVYEAIFSSVTKS